MFIDLTGWQMKKMKERKAPQNPNKGTKIEKVSDSKYRTSCQAASMHINTTDLNVGKYQRKEQELLKLARRKIHRSSFRFCIPSTHENSCMTHIFYLLDLHCIADNIKFF